MKKSLIVSLFFTLTLAMLFVSCSEKETALKYEDTDPSYPINISVFTADQAQLPPDGNKVYKWIKEKYNVEFSFDLAVGQKDQKIGLIIASGEYPDIVQIESRKFIDAGAVIPLEDLIEAYAPNLRKHYASCWERMKEDDGHIYCLPNWGVIDGRDQSTWYGDSALWIQKTVLKEFGYPKVTTMDEYFNLLKKYYEKYPTIDGMPTIPFTILTYDYHSFCLINPPNFLAGFPNDGNGTITPKGNGYEYKVFLHQDISKRWFKKLNEMYQEGLIDRSCFVDNYDQYLAKLSTGRVLGIHDQNWQFQSASTALENQGLYDRTMAPLPIVFDESIRPHYRNKKLANLGQGYGITINAKDPVRIIRFLDAQISEEAQKVLHWGFEGEDYFLDESGHPYRTPEQRAQQEDAVWKLSNKADLWYSNAPKMEGSFSDGFSTSLGEVPTEAIAGQRPVDVELWNAYGVSSYAELMDRDPPENEVWFPMWQVDPPDGSEAQLAWKKCEETYAKHLPKIIMGKPSAFEKNWDAYVKALKDAGVDKYESFMQEKLNERIKKWSAK